MSETAVTSCKQERELSELMRETRAGAPSMSSRSSERDLVAGAFRARETSKRKLRVGAPSRCSRSAESPGSPRVAPSLCSRSSQQELPAEAFQDPNKSSKREVQEPESELQLRAGGTLGSLTKL